MQRELHIEVRGGRGERSLTAWLRARIAAAAAALDITGGELSVALVDDATMQRLHAQHLDDPTTTDVLTFDLRAGAVAEQDERGTRVEGELILCRDQASRQAQARGHALREELLLYAVHGLLHLLGYDDHTKRAAATMHRREDEILRAIGVGSVYERRKAEEGSRKDG
jgi:probable rRNA maturation factor